MSEEIYKQKFINRVQKHINRVNQFAQKLGLSYPNHDSDKLSSPLLDMYYLDKKSDYVDLTDKEEKLLLKAGMQHRLNSPHHPEYWDKGNIKNMTGIRGNPKKLFNVQNMPLEAVTEMCCDWCAMSKEFGNTPFEWYNHIKGRRYIFSKEQEDYILKTLKKLWYGKQNNQIEKITESWTDSYDLYDIYENYQPYNVLMEFEDGEKNIWFPLIKPTEYKQALLEFMKMGELVRFPKDKVFKWLEIIMKNTCIIDAITALAGHTQWFPYDDCRNVYDELEDAETDYYIFSEFLDERGFYDWCKLPDGSDAWSDYGLQPLWNILDEYQENMTAEQVLVLVNRCLDVTHQRGDLPSAFIEGGSSSLTKISNESYNKLNEQIVYAGSGVQYDKPSLTAFGSNTGDAVHGYGLYYSKNPTIAKKYRNNSLGTQWLYDGKPFLENIGKYTDGDLYWFQYEQEIINKLQNAKTPQQFISILLKDLNDTIISWENAYYDTSGLKKFKKMLKNIDLSKLIKKDEGMEIIVDVPNDEYLLSESSFNSQSPYVKDCLTNMIQTEGMDFKKLKQTPRHYLTYASEGSIYQYVMSFLSGKERYELYGEENLKYQKLASEMLYKYGIKGIRYTGKNDGKCVVIFNPKDIKVIKRLGKDLLETPISDEEYDNLKVGNKVVYDDNNSKMIQPSKYDTVVAKDNDTITTQTRHHSGRARTNVKWNKDHFKRKFSLKESLSFEPTDDYFAIGGKVFAEEDEDCEVYNIYNDGIHIGMLAIEEYPNTIVLEGLEIFEKYRRQGYGKQVVDLLKKKHKRIYVRAIPSAKKFWKKQGHQAYYNKNSGTYDGDLIYDFDESKLNESIKVIHTDDDKTWFGYDNYPYNEGNQGIRIIRGINDFKSYCQKNDTRVIYDIDNNYFIVADVYNYAHNHIREIFKDYGIKISNNTYHFRTQLSDDYEETVWYDRYRFAYNFGNFIIYTRDRDIQYLPFFSDLGKYKFTDLKKDESLYESLIKESITFELTDDEFVLGGKEFHEEGEDIQVFNIYNDTVKIGMLAITEYADNSISLDGLKILPKFRRKGYGKQVVDLLKKKYKGIYVRSVPSAKKFWEKQGHDAYYNNDSGTFDGNLIYEELDESIAYASKSDLSDVVLINPTRKELKDNNIELARYCYDEEGNFYFGNANILTHNDIISSIENKLGITLYDDIGFYNANNNCFYIKGYFADEDEYNEELKSAKRKFSSESLLKDLFGNFKVDIFQGETPWD